MCRISGLDRKTPALHTSLVSATSNYLPDSFISFTGNVYKLWSSKYSSSFSSSPLITGKILFIT